MKNWRINFILFLFFLCGTTIISRLIFIQIIQGDYYRALAQGQQRIFQPLKGERGDIFFKDGKTLATNLKGKYVFAIPGEIKEQEKTAKALSQIFNLDESLILSKITKDSAFEQIKVGINGAEEQSLKEKNLAGVYCEEGIFRDYPLGDFASQLIGFLGGEGKGQYGIEGYYDEVLQGKEDSQSNKGLASLLVGVKENNGLSQGSNLYLTIDYNIQFEAERLLKRAKTDLKFESGQILVLDPNSGKIIALANYPNFNPNTYFNSKDFQIFQNSVIQKLYEPGSIFKPITIASALDQGKITPQTTYIDEGKVEIAGEVIRNYDGRIYGQRTMTEVLEKSINTGAVFVGKKVGRDVFMEYVKRFGFFENTGVDLQGEVSSENAELKKGYEMNFATACFGQGIVATPLQIVRAFAAIANGGKLVKPYAVDKIITGNKTEIIQPKVSSDRVISQKTASQLTTMLVSVINNGFGKKAQIPGYYVAGKTGTAQMPWSALGLSKRGYSDQTWQSFIGFAPAFSARFVILVKLDKPETKTAEYSALPIFHDLAKYIIDYWEIAPDFKIANK